MEYNEFQVLTKRIAEFSIPVFYVTQSYNDFINIVNKILETTETLEWGLYSPFPNLGAEMDRLFYNFISSTKLLIDTERNFITDLKRHDIFIVNYEEKKEVFKKNGLVSTVSAIRNVYTHQGPLMLTESISITNESVERKFVFRDEALFKIKKEGNKWAKEFLLNCKEIDIVLISTEYYDLIIPYYNWLLKQLKIILKNNHPKHVDNFNYDYPFLHKTKHK